jgi:hypothetical protein
VADQGTGKEGDSGTSHCEFQKASSKEKERVQGEDSKKGEVKVKFVWKKR